MGVKTKKLINLLDSLINLLKKHNEIHWGNWFNKSLKSLRDNQFAIPQILGAYGGMGSFNDLVIHPMNGHTIEKGEIDNVNNKLRELAKEIYEISNQIQKEAVFE